jgi:hypothetical protein
VFGKRTDYLFKICVLTSKQRISLKNNTVGVGYGVSLILKIYSLTSIFFHGTRVFPRDPRPPSLIMKFLHKEYYVFKTNRNLLQFSDRLN